mgnify:CR=1 FL=1
MDELIVAAIDIGTALSGYAYGFRDDWNAEEPRVGLYPYMTLVIQE